MEPWTWTGLIASIADSVDEKLLRRSEYIVTENGTRRLRRSSESIRASRTSYNRSASVFAVRLGAR